MKKLFNITKSFFKKVLTPVNLSKAIVIFLVGFLSRYLINDYLNVNVFTEYLTLVSITFYSVFAAFVVFVHEFFSFFNISIIPNFFCTMYSKLSIGLRYIFVEPFIWLYSRTWGKRVPMLHMNDPRTSADDSSVYLGDDQHHYSSIRGSHNVNSYYGRIAQQNPYQVAYSSVNRIPHPSHYPSESYDPNYDTQNYTEEYVDHNTSQQYNNTNSQEDSTWFFRIDSINENGMDRNFYTPINQPGAPEMSNLTTPNTMTPLFGSSEQINQCSNQSSQASMAFTNDTGHGTIGTNLSDSHINWPARRYNVSRAFQNSGIEAQLLKEEIRVPSSKVEGKVSLGIKYLDNRSNVQSLYVKYHDIAKRKFFWKIWEKGRGNYDSYEEFKKNFDPKMNIWKEIAKATKSDLSRDVQNLLDTNPFGTKHRTVTTRDINKVSYTTAQARLNEINARRNKSIKVSRK